MKKDISCWSLFLALILISLAAVLPGYAIAENTPAPDNEIVFKIDRWNQFKINEAMLSDLMEKKKDLILYLNDLPLKGIKVTKDQVTLKFFLERTSDTADTWKQLWKQSKTMTPNVTLSVGVAGETPIKIDDKKVYRVVLIEKEIFLDWCLGFIIALILLWVLALNTEILRNSGPAPGDRKERTYSLALSQMAMWFVVIIGGYIFLWLITGQKETITGSVLGLMGIS